MVPRRLTLRNFMSYGSEPVTLDFSGHHVLCLSGDNGNGKSALLDAMTYALWGRTRASGTRSGSEDDLVRLGAEDMEIIFDFELEGDLFRVVRRRNRRTRSGAWELQRLHDGMAIPVGGTGMRDTERRLASLLRMEYETFINSAYIQQGRADEFTRQKPADRKRILGEILNLERYGQLEELAKEHRRECEARITDLEGEMRVLEARLAEEPQFRQALEEHRRALAEAQREREAAEALYAEGQAKLAALAERRQRVEQHEANFKRLEADRARLVAALVALQKEQSSADAILADRAQIEQELQELKFAQSQLDRLAGKVEELRDAEREHTRLSNELERSRAELQHSIQMLAEQHKRAQDAAREVAALDAKVREIEAAIASAGAVEQALTKARQEKERLDNEFGELKAQNDRMKREIEELDEVLLILRQPRAQCPVCESDLSGGRQEAVLQKQMQKRAELAQEQAKLHRQGNALKQRREALTKEIEGLEENAKHVNTLRERRQQLLDRASQMRAEAEKERELAHRLVQLRTELEREDYGAAERASLTALQPRIEVLRRDVREYDRYSARVRELMSRQVEARFARLGEAERTIQRVLRDQEDHRRQIAQLDEALAAERRTADALRAELAGYAEVVEEVRAAEAAAGAARAKYDEAARQVGAAQHALDECDAAREELALRKKEHKRLEEERSLYNELAAAFGKNGLQALIIENALPEIQDEANRLLGRMTDNGMKVVLTAVRTGQSGRGQIETLDIRITDDLGERPYEMYSGGEAFRVNFAVRIALSRLLTKRAGAQLQTLILDEGFGSQDSKGRERLVEAIQSIQDEFRLIIVISHIEELKDAFPSRVEVIKTPAGSRIEYVE
ncbi:MAG: AAA family ATPase [Chthonomonadales bacterium]